MQWLKEKGMAQAAKRAERENAEGAVAVSITSAGAAIVELKCETDFVAKNADFVNLVNELANMVAENGESAAEDKAAEIEELNSTLKENIQLGRVVRFESLARSTSLTRTFTFRPTVALTQFWLSSKVAPKNLLTTLPCTSPLPVRNILNREDVPAEEVEQQRKTLEALSRNEGKPEAALPKIIEGRMTGFFKDIVLTEQAYAKDEKQTISQLLGSAKITRYAQVVIGA